MSAPPAAKKRTIVYIDGFNFYYGAVKDTPWKWLDIERYFDALRQHDEVTTIKYFTAIVLEGDRRARQDVYLKALAKSTRIEIILGKYKPASTLCRVAGCRYRGDRQFEVPREKRTDVLIAINMYRDALRDKCDNLVLVSGDSDLVPAIEIIKKDTKKTIVVYVPAQDPVRGAAVELRSAADRSRTLPRQMLPKFQFPAEVPDGRGGIIRKPAEW